MRDNKLKEIQIWCEEHNIKPNNIRNVVRGGKTEIKLTCFCKECGERYEIMWCSLKKQTYTGLCTKCAHRHSQDSRRLSAQKVVGLFEKYGYKVLTPIDRIKPIGKQQLYNKSIVTIQDKYGNTYDICWNNFHNRLQYYLDINEGGHCAEGDRELSCLEQKVADYLDELGINYKREFKFSDCRGNKRMLPFDFCLNYDKPNKLLIEADGERHYKEYFVELHKYDKIKDYYCSSHNIPLLRIPYWEFDDNTYKQNIDNFINTNSSNDTIE